ncbi:unnamed protein product [Lactuca virosa]|uniref:Glycerophosphocholine acyltransferase 1 n=1 Tax=Lactuca virosa TaxID=75947 RepID=A0AAU9MF22_9ASTR|nr:unnamed protein product [Lactuca virosa]
MTDDGGVAYYESWRRVKEKGGVEMIYCFLRLSVPHRLRFFSNPNPTAHFFIYYYSISPDTSQSKAEKDLKEYNHYNKTSNKTKKEKKTCRALKRRMIINRMASVSRSEAEVKRSIQESCSNERENEGDLVKTSCYSFLWVSFGFGGFCFILGARPQDIRYVYCLIYVTFFHFDGFTIDIKMGITFWATSMGIDRWRCSLVFSSVDKLVSVPIHLLPGVVFFTIRWWDPAFFEAMHPEGNCNESFMALCGKQIIPVDMAVYCPLNCLQSLAGVVLSDSVNVLRRQRELSKKAQKANNCVWELSGLLGDQNLSATVWNGGSFLLEVMPRQVVLKEKRKQNVVQPVEENHQQDLDHEKNRVKNPRSVAFAIARLGACTTTTTALLLVSDSWGFVLGIKFGVKIIEFIFSCGDDRLGFLLGAM